MIQLLLNNNHRCGAAILNEYWIITAAHCEKEYSLYTIVTGEHNLTRQEGSESYYKISKTEFQNYESSTENNDIALIKLKSRIIFSNYVQPICLPEVDSKYSGSYVATGWGATLGTGSDEVLRQVRLSHIDRKICNSYDVYNGRVTDSMMCAGDLNGSVNTCYGDSGGPLIAMHKDEGDVIHWVLYEITSWGTGCTEINKPGVYAKVSYFMEWIKDTIRDDNKCGIPEIKPKFINDNNNNEEIGQLIGGEEAIPHSYPWMVSILLRKGNLCGGAILNEQWIITAAQCAFYFMNKHLSYTIVTGEHNLTLHEGTESIFNISKVILYYFNRNTLNNDIALVRLKTNITFNKYVQPICLPEADLEYSGSYVATGWGDTDGTSSNTVLRQVRLSHVDRKLCNSHDVYNGRLTDSMMCAGDLKGEVNACMGDYGGPLIARHTDGGRVHWVLHGITSNAGRCRKVNKPGVYTKVSRFVEWIRYITHV